MKLQALIFCILFSTLSSVSHAYEEKPIPLTLAELTAFEDAPNLFPIKKLPDLGIGFKGFAWLNENTALAGFDHIGSWTAEHNELSKISTLNIDAGQIQETQYRGRLVCYQPDRMVVCQNENLGCSKKDPVIAKLPPYLIGKFGDHLIQADKETIEQVVLSSCETTFQIVKANPTLSESFNIGTLVREESYIGKSKNPSHENQSLVLLDNNFKIYWQTQLVNGCDGTAPIVFHPWDKTYLIGNNFYRSSAQSSDNCATHHRIFLVQPNVSAREILIPDLFEGWLQQHIAGINIAMTKNGMLVYAKPGGDPNRLGLFWVSETGAIKRFISNRLVEFLNVAPDGCHVLIQHHELNKVMVGMPATELERLRIKRTFETSVIDTCGAKQ